MFKDSSIVVSEIGTFDIISKFSKSDWHLIASDIDTIEDWVDFLTKCPSYVKSYLLSSRDDNKPFGFFYLLFDYDNKNVVSFHGGGWNKSLYYTLLHFRSAFLVAQALKKNGFKVRTCCKSYNEKAYKFLREVGYVKYRQDEDTIEMYFSERKMKRSKLYQKFFYSQT